MRTTGLSILALGLLTLAGARAESASELEAFVKDSRAMVKVFAGSLKGELQAAIREGGPVHAIPVCNVKAPEIADDLSRPPRWTVARTSHRTRNPANAPDAWEAMVLAEFQERAAAGESLTAMEKAQHFEVEGRRSYRYMKAIPVGQVCLTCHGSEIEPGLKAQIDAYYPRDRATGFALGELRGAFTITRNAED